MRHAFRLLFVLPVVAACGTEGNVARYLIDAPAPTLRVATARGTIEVRNVSLPRHATSEEIAVQAEDGSLRVTTDALWADDPARAMTGALALALDEITPATVAAEPWPLSDLPDQRLEVRVQQMVAQSDGQFRLAGQYFVAPVVSERAAVAERFDFTVPIAGRDYAAISRAAGAATTELAERIARRLAR